MNKNDQEAYDELALYTLSKRDPAFIHQYIVDAYCAQNADEKTKPVAITLALVGLYLHLEKNYSGRQVQLAHMKMAKKRKKWLKFVLPKDKGEIRALEVLKTPKGASRDEMINKWSRSVWVAWTESQEGIKDLVKKELGV